MEPIIHEDQKRKVAAFIPYRRHGDEYEFFLQKRDMNAKTNPGLFGIFGGGIENEETFYEGLMREVMEELVYEPQTARYFCKYEIATTVLHVCIEQVGIDFESKVKVQEGEYGKFFTTSEIKELVAISPLAKIIFVQVSDFLSKN